MSKIHAYLKYILYINNGMLDKCKVGMNVNTTRRTNRAYCYYALLQVERLNHIVV